MIIFTASLDAVREAEAQQRARSGAIFTIVSKPFDIDAVLGAVALALGR